MYQTLTEFLSQFSAPVQALFATLFTWGMTALGFSSAKSNAARWISCSDLPAE